MKNLSIKNSYTAFIGSVFFAFIAAALLSLSPQAGAISDAQLDELSLKADELKERLALTPEQSEQLEPLLEKSREQRAEILGKYGVGEGNKKLGRRDKFKLARELKSASKENKKAMADILTKDQLEILEEIQEELREKVKQRIDR